MYGQAIGAQMGPQSPAEIAQQQARWEKERIENETRAYQTQVAHMALQLLAGHNGAKYDAITAVETAHNLLLNAKHVNP